jgi:hypothetical protein
MVENEELPAWLVELRQQQFGEQPGEQPPTVEDREKRRGQAGMAEATRAQIPHVTGPTPPAAQLAQPEPAAPPDVLDGLREQMLQAEEEFESQEQRTSLAFAQGIMGLKPAQRLLLTILLFLNVALCGCMGLIMMGRVELPF